LNRLNGEICPLWELRREQSANNGTIDIDLVGVHFTHTFFFSK
jgi:hypothetical protein